MDVLDLIDPEHREMVRERSLARGAGQAGVPARYEIKVITKAGEARWVFFCGTTISYQGKPAVLGVAVEAFAIAASSSAFAIPS